MSFTVYVVPGVSGVPLSLADDSATANIDESDGFANGNDFGSQRIDQLFQVSADVPLTYEVQGSGRVFVRNQRREGK